MAPALLPPLALVSLSSAGSRAEALRRTLPALKTNFTEKLPPYYPETPSAHPSQTDDHLCSELATTLFRYKAFVPSTFLRDVKISNKNCMEQAYIGRNPTTHPRLVGEMTQHFVANFVFYFCTSRGPETMGEDLEDDEALNAAWRVLYEVVKGNPTLEVRLGTFVPAWQQGKEGMAQPGKVILPPARMSVPAPLRRRLEKELEYILEWGAMEKQEDVKAGMEGMGEVKMETEEMGEINQETEDIKVKAEEIEGMDVDVGEVGFDEIL
ncbi:hypothetical protein OQA88_8553 [Cercophora sp. LCS_1]